jgi:outer membrane lipoprotein-sorting protein
VGALLVLGAATCGRAAQSDAVLADWLRAQTNIHTWSADFRQTRTLKALAQPLVAYGRVHFAAPNLFHWELGQPAQTIAVRQPEQLLILYPRLQRAERFPLDGAASGPWRDALALFEAGFPRDRSELEARFHILAVRTDEVAGEISLEPKAAGARRLMPEFRLVFGTRDFLLLATELKFADGSTLRNDFTNAVLNPPIAPGLFTPEIPAGFKIADPAKGAAR